MPLYRKRPVIIEAEQWNDNIRAIAPLLEKATNPDVEHNCHDQTLLIRTLEGVMEARIGDWIVLGTKGELYPVKPDIFANLYEPA